MGEIEKNFMTIRDREYEEKFAFVHPQKKTQISNLKPDQTYLLIPKPEL